MTQTQTLPLRQKPIRTFAAALLFAIVYLGVLALVFAPKELIAVQSGAIFADGHGP